MKWLTCLPKVRCSQGQIPILLLDKFARLREESGRAGSLHNIEIVMFVNNQLVKIIPSTLAVSISGLHESLQPCSRAARKWREGEEMERK